MAQLKNNQKITQVFEYKIAQDTQEWLNCLVLYTTNQQKKFWQKEVSC